jgi:hypothetical protein
VLVPFGEHEATGEARHARQAKDSCTETLLEHEASPLWANLRRKAARLTKLSVLFVPEANVL